MCCPIFSLAQNGVLNEIVLQDANRINRLLGSDELPYSSYDSVHSFTFSSTLQYNSKLSSGYNNGAMIPATGFQQYYSVGFKKQWNNFTLQLQPELVMAANKIPDGLPLDFNWPNYWPRYYEKYNNVIDLPERFGNTSIAKVFFGQSKLTYTTHNIEFALSTENKWWGPGVYNSLVLTNNAPGFPHISIKNRTPIKTKIGILGLETIFGQLYNSTIAPSENENPFAAPFYQPKPTGTRFVTGMIFTWQPKWTPNLSIGLINMATQYNKELTGADFLPTTNFWKKDTRLSLGSLFALYTMPKDHAEFYIEYGRNDKAATPSNLFGDSIAMGFVLGVRKAIPLNNNKGAIVLNAEFTQLHLQNARLIWIQDNPALPSKTSSWYTHPHVKQGHTHYGQTLGANIGPGSNSQIIGLSWIKALNRVGIQFERVSHNNDFYFYNYFNGLPYQGPNFLYWADINLSAHIRYAWKDFIFNAEFKKLNATNYKWVKFGEGGLWDPAPISDKKNTQFSFSLVYRFQP